MQLFINSNIEKKGDQIILKQVPDLLSQIRKVLRGKIGDSIAVQNREWTIMRYTIQISDWTDKDLIGEILEETPIQKSPTTLSMLIAMPNKWDKAELVVQKLTEIGVDEIFFWPAERSIIKQWNEKKAERLMKIAQEATEQSRGVQIPTISWCDDVRKVCEENQVVVFDMGGKSLEKESTTLLGVIGPEGWLTEKDYQLLGKYQVVWLGENILRMETAAIIGGWMLKNF